MNVTLGSLFLDRFLIESILHDKANETYNLYINYDK